MVLLAAAGPVQAPGRAPARGDGERGGGGWGAEGGWRGAGGRARRTLTAARAPSQQFSMQMDLIRQQLEFEAQHIRSLMEERFGTSDEMVQRAQVRRWAGRAGARGHYAAGAVGRAGSGHS